MDETTQKLLNLFAQFTSDVQSLVNELKPDEVLTTGAEPQQLTCKPKILSADKTVAAAETAVKINPMNAPHIGPVGGFPSVSEALATKERIAVMTSKYWGAAKRTLSVSFMEETPSDLRQRIIDHMNAWSGDSISFRWTTGRGRVRIAFEPDGYWSYVGTDVLHIPYDQQTMNLQGFTMRTPESEYRRVVRHETGHTLGFPHEHMRKELVARIDPQKAYAWFARYQGWDRQTVDQQVLTPLNDRSIMATPADQTSIMCYQLPGSITTDGKPILGGTDINATDLEFARKIYPKVSASADMNDDDDNLQIAAAPGE